MATDRSGIDQRSPHRGLSFPSIAAITAMDFYERISMKLYVGRLPYQTDDNQLSDLFAQYGEVISANVITDRETGRSRGFGFVEMSNDEQAREAMNNLNDSVLEGRNIVVNEANERAPRSGGGGYRGGGGGGYRGGERRSYDRGNGGGGYRGERRY
jgi:RNA recognition motif-containing protein